MHQMNSNQDMSQEMQQCIQNCHDCQNVCLATVPHCSQMGGEHASASHIKTLLACAKICNTSADFMVINSPFHTRVGAVCAEVCDQCAQECENMANGDEQMTACAEACRRCAKSCHEMAKMAA